MADCYDPTTEMLTADGWKFVGDISDSDVLATLTAGGSVEWHQPTEVIAREHDGEMFALESGKTSFMVTPGHRMYGSATKGGPRKFHRADSLPARIYAPRVADFGVSSDPLATIELGEISSDNDAMLAKTGPWSEQDEALLREHYSAMSMKQLVPALRRTRGAIYNRARVLELERGQIGDRVGDRPPPLPKVLLSDFARFFGMWLADGSKGSYGYETRITQRKAVGREWLEGLFGKMGWKYTHRPDSDCYSVKSFGLRGWLQDMGTTSELRLPPEVWSWPREALEGLLEGFTMGDGHRSGDRWVLHSSSRGLLDDFQRVVLLLGMSGAIRKTSSAGTPISGTEYFSCHDMWSLSIHKTEHAVIERSKVKRVAYDGLVYCVTVPNHTVLTRRNGKVMWCGNCVRDVTYKFLGSFLSDIIGQRGNPAIRTGAQGGYPIGGRSEFGPRSQGGNAFDAFYKQKGSGAAR